MVRASAKGAIPGGGFKRKLARFCKSNLYTVGKIKQQATRWDNRKVFNILGLLRQYDGKSKGIDTGGKSEAELLRELLLKIFME